MYVCEYIICTHVGKYGNMVILKQGYSQTKTYYAITTLFPVPSNYLWHYLTYLAYLIKLLKETNEVNVSTISLSLSLFFFYKDVNFNWYFL